MSNMSYCRFRNTSSDWEDCRVAVADMENGDTETELSHDELNAAVDMFASMAEFLIDLSEACGKEVADMTRDDFRSYLSDLNDQLI